MFYGKQCRQCNDKKSDKPQDQGKVRRRLRGIGTRHACPSWRLRQVVRGG